MHWSCRDQIVVGGKEKWIVGWFQVLFCNLKSTLAGLHVCYLLSSTHCLLLLLLIAIHCVHYTIDFNPQ
jgi:hypothetical protein